MGRCNCIRIWSDTPPKLYVKEDEDTRRETRKNVNDINIISQSRHVYK